MCQSLPDPVQSFSGGQRMRNCGGQVEHPGRDGSGEVIPDDSPVEESGEQGGGLEICGCRARQSFKGLTQLVTHQARNTSGEGGQIRRCVGSEFGEMLLPCAEWRKR